MEITIHPEKLEITMKLEKGTKFYPNIQNTCQNSSHSCICDLRNDGIELPITESGICTTQFTNPKECDSFH